MLKKYVEYEILKDAIAINNFAVELHTSLENKVKVNNSQLNEIYLKKYLESFNTLLHNTNTVFKKNIKYIKKFSKKQAYIDELDQIISIIELIQTRFLGKLV